MPPENANKVAFAPNDLVPIIGLSIAHIKRLIAKGELPARKSGRRVLILKEDLEHYLRDLPKVA